MALNIQTFSNSSGGFALYKAVSHPKVAEKARDLVQHLENNGPVAIYDPADQLAGFAEFFSLATVEIAGVYVQNVDHIGRVFHNHAAQPVTELPHAKCKGLLIAGFDASKLFDHIRHLVPANTPWFSFDQLRLPSTMLAQPQNYLSNLNFATNFAFFRDAKGQHTRLFTANYWSNYGAQNLRLYAMLYDGAGQLMAEWEQPLPPADAPLVIDSAQVRARFKLPEFTGQLFIHILGAAGHDVVKYALDTYGDDETYLSCTHDANSWPSDRYAGLPAPDAGEKVILWVQNCHPTPMPAGSFGLNFMGDENTVWLQREIAPYATYALDVTELLPNAKWPQQIEIRAGKQVVRPRYEVLKKNGRLRISHPNVERDDLVVDKRLAELGDHLGKLHILPAPVLPPEFFQTLVQPTPMSTAQTHLPIKALVYDASGKEMAQYKFGNLKRSDSVALDVADVLKKQQLQGGYGHVELIYDFEAGQVADGWLHSLFRYTDTRTGHTAETSFGSHVFNTVLTYKNEPQSYAGRAPGLSTRLFLRVGGEMGGKSYDSFCHLIYPASMPWHATSDTQLVLTSEDGHEVARRQVKIPCSGSLLWRVSEMFTASERAAAGRAYYVLIRDTTCRLFGYHGLYSAGDAAFAVDHMFGF